MSMHKYSSYIEDQFGESFINFRPLSSENEAFEICHITAAVTAKRFLELLPPNVCDVHVCEALERSLELLPPQFQHSDFAALRRTETLEADLR